MFSAPSTFGFTRQEYRVGYGLLIRRLLLVLTPMRGMGSWLTRAVEASGWKGLVDCEKKPRAYIFFLYVLSTTCLYRQALSLKKKLVVVHPNIVIMFLDMINKISEQRIHQADLGRWLMKSTRPRKCLPSNSSTESRLRHERWHVFWRI